MTLPITLALLAVGLVLTGLFGWLGARPRPLHQPRLVPWQFLMMLAAAWSLMMLVHLLSLIGVHPPGQ